MTATINQADDGPVRILTLANPAKRNAFSGDMAARLRALLLEADQDASVRAIVITGDANTFSSGHDLQEVLDNPETAGDPEANAAFTLPAELGTPVVAAVNGAAYAAGFILALNCDIRIAGRNAKFCAVGARIGLVPVGGQLSRLLDVVTYPVAFKMLTTAAPVYADAARASGFVSDVCDPADTLARALALAHQIAEVSPAVVRAIKTGLRVTLHDGLDAGNALEPRLAAVVRDLPDGNEGVQSFLQKRPPQYPDAPTDLQDKLDKAGADR
ncbi:enoyl-CoA hydratase/isomerase family protein [Rhodococcus opacus]|uniref:Enoyl-CoA hydratase/isomerase family protein n=1 Tax=Rhodococcus opacus TaxID=37919 RepID=A0AAX3YT14_RHOOP|nr:enoyl-CoA hydratase/isomerase family protein [Rhodococcus opacus]MCZ4590509.1 enoyl-CoA hydratase/isomerase family protein [Rhodococcus opacus]WLF52226.1 enoyl-CoA hydratase/isomerase family protein [Rhodococcus opacus]